MIIYYEAFRNNYGYIRGGTQLSSPHCATSYEGCKYPIVDINMSAGTLQSPFPTPTDIEQLRFPIAEMAWGGRNTQTHLTLDFDIEKWNPLQPLQMKMEKNALLFLVSE